VRGSGFPRDVALGNEVHPAALAQILLPGVFGSLRAPVEEFWGGRFHSKGFPYFLSLYLGPVALAFAAAGWRRAPRRTAVVLAAAGALGLWYALGERGGLAGIVASVPAAQWFRFPSKAMLLPSMAAAALAGFGADRLRAGEGWRAFALVIAGAAAAAAVVAALPWAAPDLPARILAVGRESGLDAARRAASDAAVIVGICALAGAAALAVRGGRLAPATAATAVTVLLAADLARAAAGMNPQVAPAFFELLPETRALGLDRLEGGRVFSYGLDASPAFRRFAASRPPGFGLWSFFLSRQVLAPYANIVDRVELAEGKDLTSFVARPPEILEGEYHPSRVAEILPRLRAAAVTRVVGLDEIGHPELRPLARIAAGPPGLELKVYALADAWPRRYVACRVVAAAGEAEAWAAAAAPGFRPRLDVVLERPADAACTGGAVGVVASAPGDETYEVFSDGPGLLVLRDSYAPRWTAAVDGRPVPVLRANGKNRAAPVPAGRHRVRFRYAPRGLSAARWTMLGAALAALALAVRARRPVRAGEV
jgi:hypothetical protein